MKKIIILKRPTITFIMVSLAIIIMAGTSCAARKKSMAAKAENSEIPPPPPPPPAPDPSSDPAPVRPPRPVAGQKDGDAYIMVDEMPVFPGGDEELLMYIAKNTIYPKEAHDKNIQGRVIVRFMIKESGDVSDVSVMQGVDPLLDNESIRVVSTLPDFTPGKQNGVTVPVWYMVPITFKLRNSNTMQHNYDVTSEQSRGEVPFVVVEEMPMFPGGESALLDHLVKNTKYPEAARAGGVQGKVIVRFCVRADGGVDRVTVLKGVSPELDAEAIRVINTLPAFHPGKQGGKEVPVWYMAPVNFSLE